MLNLREVRIRIAVVDQGIQVIQGRPDAHFAALQGQKLGLLGPHKIKRLMSMVLAVKFGYRRIRVRLIVSEFLFRFSLLVARSNKVVPIVDRFHGTVSGTDWQYLHDGGSSNQV